MDLKQLLIDNFYAETEVTVWLLKKDNDYRSSYFNLLTEIEQLNIEDKDLDDIFDYFVSQTANLRVLYEEKIKNSDSWVAPKIYAENELVHENGKLTAASIERLSAAIVSEGLNQLVSDTGKTISFDEKWYSMISSCGFKTVAVNKLTDFISKFISPDGWKTYFVGNIGKNQKRLIQEYHVMDKYNFKHGTNYAALHLGGDTTKCVLLEVKTESVDGRGEPKSIKFLEIGAHTIIDRYDISSYKTKTKKVITEATIEDLAELFDIN